MMYYLHIYFSDGTVEYFCSKSIDLLLKVVDGREDWTIGDKPREFPAEDYLVFEITPECNPNEVRH